MGTGRTLRVRSVVQGGTFAVTTVNTQALERTQPTQTHARAHARMRVTDAQAQLLSLQRPLPPPPAATDPYGSPPTVECSLVEAPSPALAPHWGRVLASLASGFQVQGDDEGKLMQELFTPVDVDMRAAAFSKPGTSTSSRKCRRADLSTKGAYGAGPGPLPSPLHSEPTLCLPKIVWLGACGVHRCGTTAGERGPFGLCLPGGLGPDAGPLHSVRLRGAGCGVHQVPAHNFVGGVHRHRCRWWLCRCA
jgi:hypothetical protein